MQHKKSSTVESEISCFLASLPFQTSQWEFWQTFHDFQKNHRRTAWSGQKYTFVDNIECLHNNELLGRQSLYTKRPSGGFQIQNLFSNQNQCVFYVDIKWMHLSGISRLLSVWQTLVNTSSVLGIFLGKVGLNNSVLFTLIKLETRVGTDTGTCRAAFGSSIPWKWTSSLWMQRMLSLKWSWTQPSLH